MNQFFIEYLETETVGHECDDRRVELAEHHWNRSMSVARAKAEGVDLNDGHWSVVIFLRKYYLDHGLPLTARTTARALKLHFANEGGNKYLHRLFPGGPVAQGSRFANVRTPAYTTDLSFGTSY